MNEIQKLRSKVLSPQQVSAQRQRTTAYPDKKKTEKRKNDST